MGNKHTPGPWDYEQIEEHSVRPTIATIGDYRVVRSGRGARGYDLHGQDEDDARLISAAPDLLEAARCALGHLTGNMDGDMDLGEPGVMLRAAIAKAEARS